MRRISAALLALPLIAFGFGCDNDDNHRDWDRGDYRGDRIGWDRDRDWDPDRDWDRDRTWDRDRDWNRDRDRRDWDGDWDRDHDRNDHLRRDHDHRGEGLLDPDFDRNTWDRR